MNGVPPGLFQYDDPISEELSLSLEPISSYSSHFSSDCDGENNDGTLNGNPSLVSKRDRDSAITERKKQPLLHPRTVFYLSEDITAEQVIAPHDVRKVRGNS
ncbi:unnamed protein product [Orchesella dallaii]|uniref:Uncharacterized protein n=1 Tax=Orchesella dallaii TaxID=48710 RepID=A0ABP1Q4U8_9HEXA